MAKKKKATVKQGIILTKSANGIHVHIHASNGRKLAVMSGYNTKASALNGLGALHETLNDASMSHEGVGYTVIDLTKVSKK